MGLMSVAPRDKNDIPQREWTKLQPVLRVGGSGGGEGIDTLALRENGDGPSPPPRRHCVHGRDGGMRRRKWMLSHCSAGGGFCGVQILFIQDGSPVVSRDAWHAAD